MAHLLSRRKDAEESGTDRWMAATTASMLSVETVQTGNRGGEIF